MIQRIAQEWPTTLVDWDISGGACQTAKHMLQYRPSLVTHRPTYKTSRPLARTCLRDCIRAGKGGVQKHYRRVLLPGVHLGGPRVGRAPGAQAVVPVRPMEPLRQGQLRPLHPRPAVVGRPLSYGRAQPQQGRDAVCASPPALARELNVDDWLCPMRFLWAARDRVWGPRGMYDPLEKLLEPDDYDGGSEMLCCECRVSFGGWIHKERGQLWRITFVCRRGEGEMFQARRHILVARRVYGVDVCSH